MKPLRRLDPVADWGALTVVGAERLLHRLSPIPFAQEQVTSEEADYSTPVYYPRQANSGGKSSRLSWIGLIPERRVEFAFHFVQIARAQVNLSRLQTLVSEQYLDVANWNARS